MTAEAIAKATQKLVIKRCFEAPVEKVYRALVDPQLMRRWWAPGSLSVAVAESDPKVGGGYRVQMRETSGDTHTTSGVYKDVVPNERLVFSWQWEGYDTETLVTIELRAAGANTTQMTLTHEGFPETDARDKHEQGWNACLDKLTTACD